MPIELDPTMHPDNAPLTWLLGTWAGAGVVGYPTMTSRNFGQEVEVTHDGRPFLHWTSRTWLLDEQGEKEEIFAVESGYWRPQPDGDVELLLAHPTGVVEMYYGKTGQAKVEVATDSIVRSPSSPEYAAAQRLYGYVNSNLMWVMDMAAHGHEMQSYMSAELRRV
ncbi:FABP family protein [uncultured Serinicoccus sp.]|uniref:FABP family protein n=1 Tax=uncultured Serinicoccus sp. TaxID=735514 RepID=UPI002633AA72|nr:FABP family protein [uncultured Serinicoccus sp.]